MRKIYLLFVLIPFCSFSQIVILQPDSSAGNDASLGYHPSFQTMDNNYGDDIYLKAFCFEVGSDINKNRGLLQFNISDQRVSGPVYSAKLSLYATGYINNPLIGHVGNNAATLKRVVQPWNEFTITWNTAPLSTTLNMVTLPPSSATDQDYLDIDVTTLVNDMIANGDSAFGFLLQLIDESPGNALAFYSSDHSDSSKWPKLELNFSPLGSKDIRSSSLNFYPNPASDRLYVDLPSYENTQMKIISSKGELVKNISIDPGKQFVDGLSSLAPGVYFVYVIGNESLLTGKFIKQ